MRNILDIIVHDFRRLTSNVVAIVILMGLIVVPCLFAWFNILSNWDPFEPESTGKIPVAVANEDEGAEMLGMKINVGDKFIEAVNGNDMIGWDTDCDREKAVREVNAGHYYAAVIIPEDFSENVMSFTTGQMQHPRIVFYENQKTNAIAPKITGKVREVLKEEIDKAFVDTLGQYVAEAATAAEEAGLDPQDTFGQLSQSLHELDEDLAGSVSMVKAAAGLSDAAGELMNASEDVISSSESTIDLGEQLLDSAEGRIPKKADTSSVSAVIDELVALLSQDMGKIQSDLTSAQKDMGSYNRFVQKDLGKRMKLASDMKSSTDKAVKKLDSMGLTGLAGRFGRISDKLGHMIDRMQRLERADASNWATMRSLINEILSDISSSQKTIKGIDADIDEKLDKRLNKAIGDARKAIATTRNTLTDIYGDMDLLAGALDTSEGSLASLEGGLAKTAATLASLQAGSRDLADMFESLADSEILKDVNHLIQNDAEVIAENMASPIEMKTETVYPIRNFGSVVAPFYIVIAQWIGALFATVMIRVQVRRREGLGNMKLHELFLGRYRLFMMIGLAQALLVSVGALLYVGIQCVHPILFILASCVNSLTFTMMIYALVFAFENIGLAISVVVMILQVAGAGGTFPVEVLPPVFKAMFPFMPFRYAIDAMRECIGGMYGTTYIKCLAILIIMGLCSGAVGLLLHKPMKGLIEKVEESKKESDVML